jgi:hypothetical protein
VDGVPQHLLAGPAEADFSNLATLAAHRGRAGVALQRFGRVKALAIVPEFRQQARGELIPGSALTGRLKRRVVLD